MKGTSALSVFSTNAIHVQHDSLCVHLRSLEQSGIVLDDSCSEDTLSSDDGVVSLPMLKLRAIKIGPFTS